MKNNFKIELEIPLNNYQNYENNEMYKNAIRIKELPSRRQKIMEEHFNEKHYVEWLIKCDHTVGVWTNGDLSNIFWSFCENKIIMRDEIDDLLKFLENYSNFYPYFEPFLLSEQGLEYCLPNNKYIHFMKYPSIILRNLGRFWIEISLEPRGHAQGYQAMFYICTHIANINPTQQNPLLLNRHTYPKEQAILTLDYNDKLFLLEAFKIFGILSENHNYDIRQILRWIRANLNERGKKCLPNA